MAVRRYFRRQKRMGFLAAHLAEAGIAASAEVERHAAAQIRQSETSFTVEAIGRAEQREQRIIADDRQHLSLAQRPARRWTTERADRYLAEERLPYRSRRPIRRRHQALQRDTEIQRQIRLQVVV